MKFKSILIFLILIFITIASVSAENETVKNTHNTDINDTKYINTKDYYFNENGERIPYTSDTGSFNNVTMSNGYNAYAIQDGGYIQTKDSKTHPSFWNDTYYAVDANDTETVVGHWYFADKAPIGEYLKILFYNHYDDLLNSNKNYPNIPSSIFVQSYVWDLYKNAGNTEKLTYSYNREAVNLYNNGYRINNTGNIQWLNETTYRIFDFLGFKNADPTHKDLWGFKIQLFNKPQENNETDNENSTEKIENNTNSNNQTISNKTDADNSANKTINKTDNTSNIETNNDKFSDEKAFKNHQIDANIKTGNPVYILLIVLIIVLVIVLIKKQK